MLTVEQVTFLSSMLATFMANAMAVILVGYIRARIAAYFGDDTAEQLGFASLNPLVHIDVIFLISFIIFGIGIGQYPMIDRDYMYRPYATLKYYLASFANTIAYLLMAIFSLVALLVIFGPSILALFSTVASADVSVMNHYHNISSFSLSLALVGAAMVYIASRLVIFSLVINLFHMVALPFITSFVGESRYKDLLIFGSSIVFLLLSFDVLRWLTAWIILGTGYTIALLLGMGL